MAAAAGLGIKQIMRLGKKQALNFGLAIPNKKSEDPVFVVHRTKASKQLFKEAKDEGNARRGVCGKMTVSKAEVELTCEVGKPNAVMARRLREQLKDNGFRHKVVFVAPDGQRIGEAEDHDNQAAAAALKDPKPKPQPKGTGARKDPPAPAQDKLAGPQPIPYPDNARGVKLDQTLSKLRERIGKVLADHEPAKMKDMLALVEQRRDELKQDSPDFKKIETFAKQLAQWSKSYKPDAAKAPAGKSPSAKTPPAGPAQAWSNAMTGASQAMSGAIAAQVKDGEKKLAAFTKLLKQQSKGDPKGAIQAKLDKLAGSMASGMMATGAKSTAEVPAGLDLPPGVGGEVSYSGALGILQGFVEDEMQRARDAKEKGDKDEELRGERQIEAMQDGSYFERTSSYERLHKLAMRLQSGAPEQGDLAELLTFVLRETVRDEDSDKDYNLELARDNMDLAQAAGMMSAGLASGDQERIARAQADLNRALNEMMLTGAFGAIGTASNAAGAAASAAGAAGRTAARGVEAASWAGGMAGAATGMAASSAAGAAAGVAGSAAGAVGSAVGSAGSAVVAGAAAGANVDPKTALDTALGVLNPAGLVVEEAKDPVSEVAGKIVPGSEGAVETAFDVAGGILNPIGAVADGPGSQPPPDVAKAKDLVEQAATKGVTGIFDMFRGIGQMAEEAARAEQPRQGNNQGGGKGAGGPLDALGGMVGRGAQMVEQGLAKTIPPAIGFLADFLSLGGIGDKIRQIVDRIGDALRDRLRATLSWLFERLDDLIQRGDERHLKFTDMAVWLFDNIVAVKQVVDSAVDRLVGKIRQMVDKLASFVGALKDKVAEWIFEAAAKGETEAKQMLAWLQTQSAAAIAELEARVGEAGGPTRADVAKAKKALALARKEAEAEVQAGLAELRGELQELRERTEGRLEEAWTETRDRLQDKPDAIKGRLEQSYARIEAAARQTLDRSQAAVTQAWERGKAEMQEAVVETRDEVQAKVDEIKTKVSGKVDEVEAGIKRGVETGKLELSGLIDKVETETVRVVEEVETEVQGKVDEVEAKVTAKLDEVEAEIEVAAAEVTTEVEELKSELETEVDRVTEEVEAELAELEAELTAKGEELEAGVIADAKEAQGRYSDAMSGLSRKFSETADAIIRNI